MGICWSCCSFHGQRQPLSSTDHATKGNTPFGDDSNVSCSSGLLGTSKNLVSWISQPSTGFTSIWGNNPIEDNTQFSASDGQLINSNLRVFTFAQLKAATYNFRPNMVLGKGGFGSVYKGYLKERVPPRRIKKTIVAVKKLNSGSMQGFSEWNALSMCLDRSFRPLTWDTKLKIAIGTAKGLAYLHTSEKPIIYRDFKCSNILLDEFNNAKIADFVLAFSGPLTDNSHVTTSVVGTYGYAAPEYLASGRLFVKSDVYGFGVVLVEMLTGLRAVNEKRQSGQHVLVDWVKSHLTNRRKLKNVMDKRLEGKYCSKEASQVACLAVKCLRPEPQLRPSMKEVTETLEHIGATSAKSQEWWNNK